MKVRQLAALLNSQAFNPEAELYIEIDGVSYGVSGVGGSKGAKEDKTYIRYWGRGS